MRKRWRGGQVPQQQQRRTVTKTGGSITVESNANIQILKISPYYQDELKSIWLENHQKDLEPKQTSENFDVYHQTGWRAEYS